jgi:hypothetical protein
MRFAYLDESGDLAFKRLGSDSGTTDYFVVALLFVDDPVPIATMLDELTIRFSMGLRREFKYSQSDEARRRALLEELRRHEVVICATAVNKALIAGRPETASQALFYEDLICRSVKRHGSHFNETILTLDEYIRGKRQLAFNTRLRQTVNTEETRHLAEIKHQKSKSNNVIQVTDMVAGAIYRARAHNDDRFLRIIQPRIHDLWDWDGTDEREDSLKDQETDGAPS